MLLEMRIKHMGRCNDAMEHMMTPEVPRSVAEKKRSSHQEDPSSSILLP
jgi:hypothetical protein